MPGYEGISANKNPGLLTKDEVHKPCNYSTAKKKRNKFKEV